MDDVFSEAEILKCCVAQGSILVSHFFKMYINELTQSSPESSSNLYAADTCFFYQDKDVHKIEDVLNKEFSKPANDLLVTGY